MAKVVQLKTNKDAIAKKLPATGKPVEAIADHLRSIKTDPLNNYAYNRLMIIYRKNKDPKKELAIINKAIRAFESFYHSSKKKQAKAVHNLSLKLSKTLGLTDKKGKPIYDMEPVRSWKKRREVVMKKMEH